MSSHPKAMKAGSISVGDKDSQNSNDASLSAGGKAMHQNKAATSAGRKAIKSSSPTVRGKAMKVTKTASPSIRGSTSKEDPISAEEGDSDMRSEDITFIMECIRNAGDSVVNVDVKRVAEALNYTNTRSVSNRITKLKKKYNLPITASNRGVRKSDSGLAAGPATPKKAIKIRVTSDAPAKVKKYAKTIASGDDVCGNEGEEVDSSEKIGIARYIGPTTSSGSDVDEAALEESEDNDTDDDDDELGGIKVEEEEDDQDEY